MKTYLALALICLACGCSDDSNFKAAVKAKAIESKPLEVDPKTVEGTTVTKTLELKLTSKTAPIDMVWVVDNSSSMSQEVAQVRSNIAAFVAAVGKEADLKVSILSNEDSRFGLTFDSSMISANFLQVKQKVGSYSELAVLASAICDVGNFKFEGGKTTHVCGEAMTTEPEGNANEDSLAVPFAGSLQSYLRKDVQKVFVIVTDDTPRGYVTATNFFSLTKLKVENTHFFGFAGIKKRSGCEIANIGAPYLDLATQTGGEIFDICETDWSANFSKLTESVKKLTSNSFDIPEEVKTLKSVTVDGTVLTSKQYFFGNKTLTIVNKDLLNEKSKVVVAYEIKE